MAVQPWVTMLKEHLKEKNGHEATKEEFIAECRRLAKRDGKPGLSVDDFNWGVPFYNIKPGMYFQDIATATEIQLYGLSDQDSFKSVFDQTPEIAVQLNDDAASLLKNEDFQSQVKDSLTKLMGLPQATREKTLPAHIKGLYEKALNIACEKGAESVEAQEARTTAYDAINSVWMTNSDYMVSNQKFADDLNTKYGEDYILAYDFEKLWKRTQTTEISVEKPAPEVALPVEVKPVSTTPLPSLAPKAITRDKVRVYTGRAKQDD